MPGDGDRCVALAWDRRRVHAHRAHAHVALPQDQAAQMAQVPGGRRVSGVMRGVELTALQEFCLRIPRPALRSILRISRHMRTQYQNRQNALRAICQMRIARNTQSSP